MIVSLIDDVRAFSAKDAVRTRHRDLAVGTKGVNNRDRSVGFSGRHNSLAFIVFAYYDYS